jgi:hypothetical protein
VATALKYNGVYAIILSASLLFVFVTALVSNGLIVSTVTLSNYGTISNAPTYQISQISGTIKVTNAVSGSTVYSGTSANDAFSTAFGYVRNGGIVNVQPGTYTATGTYPRIIMQNCVNVIVNFDPASLITIAPNKNDNVFFVQNCTNCVINGARIDGNGANQVTTGVFGWGICLYGSSNIIIRNSNIFNCVLGDIGLFYASNPADTANNIIENNVLGACGWNCITAWGYRTVVRNNDISHASDVGVASYEDQTLIQSNHIHDIDGSTGDQNSHYGIAVEGNGSNGYNIIENNTIENCTGNWAVGIAVGTGAPVHGNIVRGNVITNCNSGITTEASTGDVISQNQITNWGSQSGASGIGISRSNNEILTFNTLVSTNTNPGVGAGVFIQTSNYSAIHNNTIATQLSAQTVGIYATTSSNNNLILRNTVLAKTGLQIADGSSNGNGIYENYFTGCTNGVINGGTGTILSKPSTSILNINIPSLNGAGNPTQGRYVYSNSSQVTITLSPSSGYTSILNVDGANVSLVGNAYTLSMNRDHAVYAIFSKT